MYSVAPLGGGRIRIIQPAEPGDQEAHVDVAVISISCERCCLEGRQTRSAKTMLLLTGGVVALLYLISVLDVF